MKQDFKQIWKNLADKKANTAVHTIQYCILKAIAAKNASFNDRKKILENLLSAAFNPHNSSIKRTLAYNLKWVRYQDKILNEDALKLLSNPKEEELYNDLIATLDVNNIPPTPSRYLYIFVRKDLPNVEQIAVQASHAAYVSGNLMPTVFSASVNFVLVGVENQKKLLEVGKELAKNKLHFVQFQEPDLGNELTAIATRPIKARSRRSLLKYETLKIGD